jgi:PAS domain S-box-containing protein
LTQTSHTAVAVEAILERALSTAPAGVEALRLALDEMPAPIYVTDLDGVVIYFNPACIDFTGRQPLLGRDRWCVTWKLFTNAGDFLPHDECPMAVALNTRRPVRGVTAVAERPDGTRVHFRPYPTPILDADGEMIGAVNILIDVTDEVRAEDFLAQARRCRRLSKAVDDRQVVETLTRMAEEYEAKAAELGSRTSARHDAYLRRSDDDESDRPAL